MVRERKGRERKYTGGGGRMKLEEYGRKGEGGGGRGEGIISTRGGHVLNLDIA